jgi:antitoxin VapB
MSLNIKNPRVHALAREAARRFGMSQTSVIEEALVRMLATHDEASGAGRQARVEALLADVDRHLTDDQRAALRRHDDLYDGAGLPA